MLISCHKIKNNFQFTIFNLQSKLFCAVFHFYLFITLLPHHYLRRTDNFGALLVTAPDNFDDVAATDSQIIYF